MDRIVLLQGEAAARTATMQALRAEQRWDVCAVASPREAWTVIERQFVEMVVAELTMVDGATVELLQRIQRAPTPIPFLVITGYHDELVRQRPEVSKWDVLKRPLEEGQLVERLRQKLADKKLSSPPDSAFTVADYLQLAGMARRSVIIHVENSGVEGQIVVQNGAPVWARDREGIGRGAFQRLALLPRADINCQPCTTWSTKPNLEGSLEQLLLDAARRADEIVRTAGKSRATASAPIAVATPTNPTPATAPPLPPNRAIPRPNLPPPRRERPESPAPALELGVNREPVGRAVTLLAASSAPAPTLTDDSKERQAPPASSTQSRSTPSPHDKDKGMSSDTRSPDSQRILTGVPAISAIARADQEGSVLDYAGTFDAETACAGVLLVVFGAWTARSSISKPISDLTYAAREMSTGNLKVEFHPTGAREVQELGASFDRMRASRLAAFGGSLATADEDV